MSTKTMKLPEKITNLSAENFEDIFKNPGKYGLTVGELFQISEYASNITASLVQPSEDLKKENEQLKKENEQLKNEVAYLKKEYEDTLNELPKDITDQIEGDLEYMQYNVHL